MRRETFASVGGSPCLLTAVSASHVREFATQEFNVMSVADWIPLIPLLPMFPKETTKVHYLFSSFLSSFLYLCIIFQTYCRPIMKGKIPQRWKREQKQKT